MIPCRVPLLCEPACWQACTISERLSRGMQNYRTPSWNRCGVGGCLGRGRQRRGPVSSDPAGRSDPRAAQGVSGRAGTRTGTDGIAANPVCSYGFRHRTAVSCRSRRRWWDPVPCPFPAPARQLGRLSTLRFSAVFDSHFAGILEIRCGHCDIQRRFRTRRSRWRGRRQESRRCRGALTGHRPEPGTPTSARCSWRTARRTARPVSCTRDARRRH